MRVFVLGASGDQGMPLVARLLSAGHHVTAGLRDPSRAPAGTQAVAVDLLDTEQLALAMRGHDALAFHLPFVHDRSAASRMGRSIATAVRTAGVARAVFNTSCYVADDDIGLEAHDGRRAIEAAMAESGAAFTSIRPSAFMDNLGRGWARPAIMRGVFAYPAAASLKMSWVAIDDIAAAMTAVLARDDLPGARIPLGGPEALTGSEAAERLSTAIGRPIRFMPLDPSDFAADMAELVTGSREIPAGSVYHGMARFYDWYNAQPTSPLIAEKNVLALRLTSLREWAERQDWRTA